LSRRCELESECAGICDVSADRRGYRLKKSRSRDPGAIDYGRYAFVDVQTGGTVNPAIANRWVHSWTLDEVEAWLQG
jgi:hypothetical protein